MGTRRVREWAKANPERARQHRGRGGDEAAKRRYAASERGREVGRAKSRRYYHAHPEYASRSCQIYGWRRLGRLLLVKQELGGRCVDCGQDYPLFLEFDHKDGSTKERIVTTGGSVDRMRKEASKCELRCANCHNLKTWINKESRHRYSDAAARVRG